MAPKPPAAVAEAMSRRAGRKAADAVRWEWFINQVLGTVNLSLKQRVKVAANMLKSQVVRNISKPVTKLGGGRVTDRSNRGEFPKADTTRLMKDIFDEVFSPRKGVWDGAVGTTLDYGLILELRMDREFLKKTLEQQRNNITRILTKTIT